MKHIVSGIQPTGSLNLGTYLGSIKNFIDVQRRHPEHQLLLFIADLHALTVPQDKMKLRKTIKELAALYLASGLNQDTLSLFIQSEIPAHAQMAYLLQCFTYMGELERMTQFKDKAQKQTKGVSSALFTYPALMAGDILLYDAQYVPVGEDQKQHLELTRDIAIRLNNRFGSMVTVPEPLIPKVGARIMSLTDPTKKMSKSDVNVKSRVNLLDDETLIRKRIMSAVTDSEDTIRYDTKEKPGIANLITIYSAITGQAIPAVEATFKDSDYATFKRAVADAVIGELAPIQARYHELKASPELDRILDEGKAYADRFATNKIRKLQNALGLGRKRK